jgi:hypothetical protein
MAQNTINSVHNSIDSYLHKINEAESGVLKLANLVDTERQCFLFFLGSFSLCCIRPQRYARSIYCYGDYCG